LLDTHDVTIQELILWQASLI